MTLFALDIAGTACTPAATSDPPPASGYRMIAWDLADPALLPWLEQALPPSAANALSATETRPRALATEDGTVLILRAINLNPGQKSDDMVSLRLYFSDRLLVAVRARRVFALETVRQEAEAGRAPKSPTRLAAALAELLTGRLEAETIKLEEAVDRQEDELLSDAAGQPGDPDALPGLRRVAIQLRRFALPQALALEEAATLASADRQARGAFHEAENRTRRAVELLDAARERLMALADHTALIEAREQGRNAYLLSLVAAVFLPLGFLTGLFGVNLAGIPGTETPWAFAALAAITVLVGVATVAILRRYRLF